MSECGQACPEHTCSWEIWVTAMGHPIWEKDAPDNKTVFKFNLYIKWKIGVSRIPHKRMVLFVKYRQWIAITQHKVMRPNGSKNEQCNESKVILFRQGEFLVGRLSSVAHNVGQSKQCGIHASETQNKDAIMPQENRGGNV